MADIELQAVSTEDPAPTVQPAAKPLGAVVAELFGRMGKSSWVTLISIGGNLLALGMVAWLKVVQQQLQAGTGNPCPVCAVCPAGLNTTGLIP